MNGDAWTPDTRPRREGCAPADLLAAVQLVHDRHPLARLVRNRVGNLSVMVNDEPVAFVDLTFGEVVDLVNGVDSGSL